MPRPHAKWKIIDFKGVPQRANNALAQEVSFDPLPWVADKDAFVSTGKFTHPLSRANQTVPCHSLNP